MKRSAESRGVDGVRVPDDEGPRLRVLQELAILDTDEEEAFDRITAVAAHVFQVPVALISLVDNDRQWFKSRVGTDVTETPRENFFCTEAICETSPLVVEDASSDPRFNSSSMVSGPPYLRFYAGAQLRTRYGHDLGTLCILDTQPRPRPSDEELQVLVGLADTVTLLIEQRRIALQLNDEVQQRAAAENAAAKALSEAEAATEAMRQFFSQMSHELRTPLNGILGYAEFLRDEDLSAEQKEDVEEIYQGGRKLLRLIDELLKVGSATARPDEGHG